MRTRTYEKALLFAIVGCSVPYFYPSLLAAVADIYVGARDSNSEMVRAGVFALRQFLAPVAWAVFFAAVYAEAIGFASASTRVVSARSVEGVSVSISAFQCRYSHDV